MMAAGMAAVKTNSHMPSHTPNAILPIDMGGGVWGGAADMLNADWDPVM